MMLAHRWLVFTALAASLLTRAAGASPAEEKQTTSDHALIAADSLDMIASAGLGLYAPSLDAPNIGGGIASGVLAASPDWPTIEPQPPAGETVPGTDEPPNSIDEPEPDPLQVSVGPSVPEPGVLPLFGGALLGILGLRAVRKRFLPAHAGRDARCGSLEAM